MDVYRVSIASWLTFGLTAQHARRQGWWWLPGLAIGGVAAVAEGVACRGASFPATLGGLLLPLASAIHLAVFIRLARGAAVTRALYLGLTGLLTVAWLRLAAGMGSLPVATACAAVVFMPAIVDEAIREHDHTFGDLTFTSRMIAMVVVAVFGLCLAP